MKIAGSGIESQLEEMREAYNSLRSMNPKHPLLNFVEFDNNELKLNYSYYRGCVSSNDRFPVCGYARYTIALRAVLIGQEFRLLNTDPPCEY